MLFHRMNMALPSPDCVSLSRGRQTQQVAVAPTWCLVGETAGFGSGTRLITVWLESSRHTHKVLFERLVLLSMIYFILLLLLLHIFF